MRNDRRKAGMILVVALGLLLTACGDPRRTEGPVPAEPGPAGSEVNLDGTEWILASLHGADLVEGTNITLGFANGNANGFAGCNAYGGAYTVMGIGTLSIPEMAITAQGCVEPKGVMEQESSYLEALQNAERYHMVDDRLELQNAAGETVLVFQRKVEYAMDPAQLVGTAWRLVSTNDKPPVEGTTITLVFEDQSRARGHAGCRDYTATYEASGDDIRFPALSMSGDEACLDEEAVYLQEGKYSDALTWTTNYRLKDGLLEITTARGEVLIFEPLPDKPVPTVVGAGPDFPPTDYGCESPFNMAWNSHRLEGLSEQVQAALAAAGFDGAEGVAKAYGEDWYEYDEATGDSLRLCNFTIKQTDFYVRLPSEDLGNLETLGTLAAGVLDVLDDFPTHETPGSQPGYIKIVFFSGEKEAQLWFSATDAAGARSKGLGGSALLEVLGYSGFPCHGYLDLLVYADGVQEQAVVTCYRCHNAMVDSAGQAPAKIPSLVISAGEPLRLHLGAERPPESVEVRLYPEPGLSASFFRWPEELPIGAEPVKRFQFGATSSFHLLPEVPPGEYSVVVRAVWDEAIDVFYAASVRLE